MQYGIVIVDHGSRRQESNRMLEHLAALFHERFADTCRGVTVHLQPQAGSAMSLPAAPPAAPPPAGPASASSKSTESIKGKAVVDIRWTITG